jgi:anti-sigma regulatory factor (Ser/Thr protein kinase)
MSVRGSEPGSARPERGSATAFRHEAIFYAGPEDFVARTASFIREGVRAREPILVVVDAPKIDRLRSELGEDAGAVRFEDMARVGANPARIIPAWREFVDEHAPSGRPFRGIGEPISAARTVDELVECERHEALLNLAFADAPPWRLACPYDVASLPPPVLEEAERNHPILLEDGGSRSSASYRGLDDVASPFELPLAPPPAAAAARPFDRRTIAVAREWVAGFARDLGLADARVRDLGLAVHELITNAVRHGGGAGTVAVWPGDRGVVVEVRDAGRIVDPLLGRTKPAEGQTSGFGTWIVTQLCDLVQVRSTPEGTAVRVHVRG